MIQIDARGERQSQGSASLDDGEYLRLEDVPGFDAPLFPLGPGMRSVRPISPFRGMPARLKKLFDSPPRPVIPYSPAVFAGTKKEVLLRRRVVPTQPKATVVAQAQASVSLATGQLKRQLVSVEFWLGVIFGAVTRFMTRAAIATAIASEAPMDASSGLAACAIAGIAAGIVAYAARISYRNAKVANAKDKESYWTSEMFTSGLLGLAGGIVGGGVTNIGGYFARAGSFVIGAITGGTYVIARAVLREASGIKALREANNIARLAFEGAAFVFVGGLFGVVFAELLTVRDSIAAPSEMAGNIPASPPYPMPMMVDPCGDAMCGIAVPMPPPQVIYVPVQPPTTVVVKETIKVKKKVAAAKPCCHHHHQVKPKAVVKHQKLKAKPVESVVVLPPPPPQVVFPIVAPPPAMTPVPAPMYINPCQMGECAPGCDDMSMLDLQGPCSGPNAASCVQRISFNEDGEATRAVLEQRFGSAMGPHFEYGAANLRVEGPVWSQTTNSRPATGASGESPVSFVMPFVNGLSATNPAPAYMPG